jgi:hypothetical protein
MMYDAPSIPFRMRDLYSGFAEARGLMRFTEDGIRLEYQVRDAVIGVISSGVRELFIPFEDVDSMTFHKRWWRRSIEIRTHSLRFPATIPGLSDSCIVIRVRRADRARIRQAIAHASLRMAEIRLQQIEKW